MKNILKRFFPGLGSNESGAKIRSDAISAESYQRDLFRARGITLSVFNAHGGKVIQVHNRDDIHVGSVSNLYIITNDDDLGVELGQIITREFLSR